MNLADKMGFGPQRQVVKTDDGRWCIFVTPNPMSGSSKRNAVILNDYQYRRYLLWRDGSVLIQDALPDLTANQREILMSGLGQDDWDRMTKESDE